MKDSSQTIFLRTQSVLFALLLALAVFVVDQVAKRLVEDNMSLGESTDLMPGILRLTHIENAGGAFGIFAGQATLLLVGSAIAVGVVLWMLLGGEVSRFATLGCGLILGGAAGNLFDRLSVGKVTDYIDLQFWPLENWPVFNTADTAITLGVVALLLGALRSQEKSGRRSPVR